ncbi:MAG: PAS domain-containing protein, partial [Gammaproteobacteria bacterium]
ADGEFEGVIEVEHDVTQIVQMQSGLIASEARLQATMDNVPDAILTCSREYVIESANRSALSLFNGDKKQLVGRSLGDFFFEAGGLEVFESGQSMHQQTQLQRLDGSEFPADMWIGPLRVGDGNPSLIVVIRDVTSWIQAQRELDSSRQQYFHHDKMVAIGQLAAGILHEVGNPIAAIAGAVDGVKQSHAASDVDDAVNRNIELIEEQIARLGKITREIADFASPKPRERELFDLNGLLRSTTQLLTYDRRFGSIGVTLELDKNLPAIIGVADQLTQVFMNLLINAMDACAAHDSREDCIRLTSELEGDHVHVCVQDYGIGMSQETLAHVMELFYTTKPVGEGSGMGLSLCDTIVRAHKGSLTIESEEGVGTRVHVVLPLDAEQEQRYE